MNATPIETPARIRHTRNLPGRILGPAVLSLSAAGAVMLLIPGAIHWPAWTAGWLVSALNAAMGTALHSRAIGMDINRFLLWGFAGNTVRLLILFAGVCTFTYLTEGPVRRSFLASCLASSVVWMVFEIFFLFQFTVRNNLNPHGAKQP